MLRRFGSSGFNATQRAPPSPAPRAPTTIGRGSNPTDAVKTKTKKKQNFPTLGRPRPPPYRIRRTPPSTLPRSRTPPPLAACRRTGRRKRTPPSTLPRRAAEPSALRPAVRAAEPTAAAARSAPQIRPPEVHAPACRAAAGPDAPNPKELAPPAPPWGWRHTTSPPPLRLSPPPHACPCSTPPRDWTGADRGGAELIVSNSAASWRFGG